MKVAILHRYFWPESISAFPLIYGDIAQLHIERGDDVTVYAGADQDYSAAYRDRFGDQITVKGFTSTQDRELSTVRRAMNALRLVLLAFRVLAFGPKPDVMYVATYPPFLAPIVILLGRVFSRKTRFIFYMQDLLVYRMPGRPLKWLYATSLAFAISRTALSVIISESMRDEVLSYFSAAQRPKVAPRIAVMRNYSVDFETAEEAAQSADVAAKVDIIYAGSHGKGQNLSAFLEALGLIQGAQPSVVFYGSGTEKDTLRAQAERLKLNVVFHDPVSRDEVRQRIKEARFGLVGAMPDLMKYAFPSKLATYNSVGVQGMVMCAAAEREAIWIKENGLGIAIDPNAPEVMAKDIARALAQTDAPDRQTLIQSAHDVFSKENYLAKFSALLDDLDGPKSR